MAACKDCIHERVCFALIKSGLPYDDLLPAEAFCMTFKNKTDVVEVVRCKDCIYHIAEYCTRDIKGRTNMFYMTADDFCSYGKLKESEKVD